MVPLVAVMDSAASVVGTDWAASVVATVSVVSVATDSPDSGTGDNPAVLGKRALAGYGANRDTRPSPSTTAAACRRTSSTILPGRYMR
jgi:hypothetical protein